MRRNQAMMVREWVVFMVSVKNDENKCVLIYCVLKLVFVEKAWTDLVVVATAALILILMPNGLELLEASSGNFMFFECLCQMI